MTRIYLPLLMAILFLGAAIYAAHLSATIDGRFGLALFFFGAASAGFGIRACEQSAKN